MHSLSPDYLAKLRFDAQQLATLRALGEYRGKQQLYVAQSPEVLSDLRQVCINALPCLSKPCTVLWLSMLAAVPTGFCHIFSLTNTKACCFRMWTSWRRQSLLGAKR